MRELNQIENKMVKLVEERGVAAFPYITTIKQILEFVQKNIVGISQGETKTVTIPNNLTSKIDFINDLNITITVEDGENLAYKYGGGCANISKNTKLIDGKIDYCEISVDAYSFCGILYKRTIYNNLCHEINHLYEAWKELTHSGTMEIFAKQATKASVDTNWFNDANLNNFFKLIFYRLYSETELNALIAGVYGDLTGMHSQRVNFARDIKRTQAYKVYLKIKIELNDVVEILKDNPNLIGAILNIVKNYGIELNPYNKSPEGYIKEFKRKTLYLLKQLLKGIGKVASLYYDSTEVPEDDYNITIK
jgi:hypothetical protein